MRSKVLLLAIGLLVADSALASPCKPRSSTSETAISTPVGSTTQPTSTVEETPTVASSETSTETGAITTTAPDTTATSEAETTTAVQVTTTTAEAETTTAVESTTTTAEAESTTTTAVATPTFTIVGGGGAIQGAPLQGTDQDGSVLLFNPQTGTSRTRTIILDPDTGRLRDKDTGVQICAYYGSANTISDPAYFAFCQNGNTGRNLAYDYMTCQIVSGKLSCTAPQAACPTDDDGIPLGCTTVDGQVNNEFYYKTQTGAGTYLFISSGSPNGYTPVDVIAQEA
ncbi:hypothetical protein RAB80_009691 [Fusarium oxysporum f. sp. vasinfectum]|uniref:Uncharacterized protein n=1 Tax=Fusarium oxysporum f. sp. vasinfectum 25433 TaxID=1089449 RepID=X0L4Q2_FUSOX|nr:hypothetical protein FOTG_15641 [Fusarium oxysporum f. sp. vasinfectum 25433]KAK2674707.1 hypothetical protein RAB80_009691 [Fusarium oxysporum f. sp. vasinfectum]KAK2931143.1 hypothetical protein FoTM2_008653 [Fusarium oxysporum f. sp. vasinfectum]